MTMLHRLNVIPSTDWSAIPTGGRQLRWAAMDGDVIATFWEAQDNPTEATSGWQLIRTDVLPFETDLVGGPPPYRPRHSGIDGAVAFVNNELFLWVYEIPVWTPPLFGVTGEAPVVTMYPKNTDLVPPGS